MNEPVKITNQDQTITAWGCPVCKQARLSHYDAKICCTCVECGATLDESSDLLQKICPTCEAVDDAIDRQQAKEEWAQTWRNATTRTMIEAHKGEIWCPLVSGYCATWQRLQDRLAANIDPLPHFGDITCFAVSLLPPRIDIDLALAAIKANMHYKYKDDIEDPAAPRIGIFEDPAWAALQASVTRAIETYSATALPRYRDVDTNHAILLNQAAWDARKPAP